MSGKKKKILICSSSYRSLVNFRGKLITELISEGYAVYASTPQIEENKYREMLERLGVVIIENRLQGNKISIINDFLYFIHLIKIILTIKPDLFFSYTYKPIIYGSIAAKLLRVNSISCMITGLGHNFTSQGVLSQFTLLLLKKALSCNNNIILQNEDDYSDLIKEKILNPQQNIFIVNGSGVDLIYFYQTPPPEKITFLLMSRLLKAKGISEYYLAAERIKKKYPNVDFILLGEYEKGTVVSIEDSLHDKIIKKDVIHYKGRVEDVRGEIINSSVVVLPSYYREGVPRSLLEAMSMGRAIITTNAAGCRETINPQNPNGFLIPIKNIDELYDKMEHFILNPKDIPIFGDNSRKFAEEKYDVNLVNKVMIEILTS